MKTFSNTVFSSSGIEVTMEDLNWIFRTCATASPLTSERMEDLYIEMFDMMVETDAVIASEDCREESEEEREKRYKELIDSLITAQKKWEAARLKAEAKEEKWMDSFPDPKKFLEAYEEFRHLFFSIGLNYDGLEEAIVFFLCYEGGAGLAAPKNKSFSH